MSMIRTSFFRRSTLLLLAAALLAMAVFFVHDSPPAAAQQSTVIGFSAATYDRIGSGPLTEGTHDHATITLNISPVLTTASSVTLRALTGDSAHTAEANDYTLPTTVTLPANSATATFQVALTDDALAEFKDVVVMRLEAVANAPYTLDANASRATVVITDNDVVTLSFSAQETAADGYTPVFRVAEGGSVSLNVVADRTAEYPVGFSVSTGVDGDASTPDATLTTDYVVEGSPSTIPAGATSPNPAVVVRTVPDNVSDDNEVLTASIRVISGGSNVQPSPDSAIVIIGAPTASTPSLKLATPENVRATVGDGTVTVYWDAVTNADSYIVESGEHPGGALSAATGTWTFRAYFGLTNGQTYRYRVRAIDSHGNHTRSDPSGWITATPSKSFNLVSSTLTVGDGGVYSGYHGPASIGTLPNASFTYDGVDYEIKRLSVLNGAGTLQLVLDKPIPDRLKSALTLTAGRYSYTLSRASRATIEGVTNDSVTWAARGRSWSVGDRLSVVLSATDHWSATLTVRDLLSDTQRGCDDLERGDYCSSHLTDNTFTYGGAQYQVVGISSVAAHRNFGIAFDRTIPDSLDNLVLHVDGRRFVLGDGLKLTALFANDTRGWDNVSLGWSVGDTVKLRLTEPRQQVGGL